MHSSSVLIVPLLCRGAPVPVPALHVRQSGHIQTQATLTHPHRSVAVLSTGTVELSILNCFSTVAFII